MDRGTVARIEDWESSPLSGGHAGLWTLAEQDFSGAVNARGAWLFMLNGRVVGVFGGSMATFEDAEGTAYRAPHPSLPLLFAMQERGGETQAKYYTDDTPLSEVDGTLSESNFTGYVELSENVLSGDYYVVYYGGRSMAAAFIGNAEQLLTGDEAFERANDEVGIYEVREVDLDVQEVPEPDDPGSVETAVPGVESGTPAEDAADAEAEAAAPEPEPVPDPEDEPPGTTEESEPEPAADSVGAEEPTAADESAPSPDDPAREPERDAPEPADDPEPEEPAAETAGTTGQGGGTDSPAERPASDEEGRSGDSGGEAEDPFTEEEEWRETRTIPALDPDESAETGETAGASGADRTAGGGTAESEARSDAPEGESAVEERPSPQRDAAERGTDQADAGAAGGSTGDRADRGGRDERVRELRSRLEEREAELEERRAELEDLQSRLAEATDEREALREERDRLRERVEQLEAQVERLGGDAPESGAALTPEEALTQTDLFVRYDSKGKATLEDAHGGEADRDDLVGNLRLEQHTRFEADEASVAGEPFEAYLAGTVEHRFVEWVIEDLLFEVRATGNDTALSELYDALPAIDRVEFQGTITTRDDEGEERRESFDVVMRDRMGQPLFVANINDARDPATGEMMGDLVERSKVVADGHDSLGGAFLVTSSFFEPNALETAAEATGGGFLDRGSKKSFVKLSRKRGYHLCLVEARGDDFHVAVPEL